MLNLAEFSRNMFLPAMFLVLSAASSLPAHSADVGCDATYTRALKREDAAHRWPSGAFPKPDTCSFGYLRGPITPGDSSKVVEFLRRHHPFLNAFLIQSPGGSANEAMQIGELLRRYRVGAIAPDRYHGFAFLRSIGSTMTSFCEGKECVCTGSCALIWYGSPDRTGSIGLQAPRIDDSAFSTIKNYLERMEAPTSSIKAMVATGSSNMVWIDDRLVGGASPPKNRAPSFAEWADAACGPFSHDEHIRIYLLGNAGRPLTASEQTELDALEQKHLTKASCEADLVSSFRDKLAAP